MVYPIYIWYIEIPPNPEYSVFIFVDDFVDFRGNFSTIVKVIVWRPVDRSNNERSSAAEFDFTKYGFRVPGYVDFFWTEFLFDGY